MRGKVIHRVSDLFSCQREPKDKKQDMVLLILGFRRQHRAGHRNSAFYVILYEEHNISLALRNLFLHEKKSSTHTIKPFSIYWSRNAREEGADMTSTT